MPNNALFCDVCGEKTQTKEFEKSFCGNCGTELEPGVVFCGKCGYSTKDNYVIKEVKNESVKKKSRTGMATIIIILLCIIVALSAIVGYMIYSNDDADTNTSIVVPTIAPKVQSVITPSPTSMETPTPTDAVVSNTTDITISNRADLYNPSLTYKRMADIHNTVLTNDKTYNELKSVIIEFNSQCEDYMNEITDKVPSSLKYGTTAYNQQVEYKQKHPLLNQSYQKVDVINARQDGGYYYVWVTEVLNVNENGIAQTNTDHWVYKIENNNGQWYICDYTSDPAF